MTDFPTDKIQSVRSGGVALGEVSPLRGLTWVNLWAAWCEPCKKEMPIILQFQERLRTEGLPVSVAFVSIDDDERQLDQFLAKSPKVGATFWLSEGSSREKWLTAAGLAVDPRLPVHLLVDTSKKTFCRIEGSIDAEDFELVAREFKKAG
jgi:thiol-disulfide isomerase/thioredoxin